MMAKAVALACLVAVGALAVAQGASLRGQAPGAKTRTAIDESGKSAAQLSAEAWQRTSYFVQRQMARKHARALALGVAEPARAAHHDAAEDGAMDVRFLSADPNARTLTDGEVVEGHVERGAYEHFTFNAGIGLGVNIWVSPRFGDPDLFVNCADGNDFPTKANNMWSSAHPGGDETVSVEPEQGGCDKYQISVMGYTNSSFSISATTESYVTLYPEMPVYGTVQQDAYTHYKFDTGSYGMTTEVTLSVTTGDADLYISCDDFPTIDNARWSSRTAGGDDIITMYGEESCEIDGNVYFISVYGFTAGDMGSEFDISVSQYGGGSSSWGGPSSWGGGSWSSGGGYTPPSDSGSNWWGPSGSSGSWTPSGSGSAGGGPGPDGGMPLQPGYPFGGITEPHQYQYYTMYVEDLQNFPEGVDVVVTFLDGRANLFMGCSDDGLWPSAMQYRQAAFASEAESRATPFVSMTLSSMACDNPEEMVWLSVTTDNRDLPANYTISAIASPADGFSFYPLENTPQGFEIQYGGSIEFDIAANSGWASSAEVTIDNFQSDFNLTIWAADDGSTPSSSHFKWHDEVAPGYSSHIMFQNLSAMYDISVVVDNGNSASPAWIAATTHIYYADDETRKAESERLRSLKAARDAQQE